MDILSVLIVMGALLLAGAFCVILVVNNKYPSVQFEIVYKGVKQTVNYRLFGNTIVEDNIIGLLLNQYKVCGDIAEMESFLVPVRFGLLTIGMKRVYIAVMRYGYLFALVEKDKQVAEVLEKKPVFKLDKNKTFSVSNNGVIVPYSFEYTNAKLTEKEVTNGKAICSRFVENQRANKQFNEATNPFISMLVYSLPLFMIVIAVGVVLYLAITSSTEVMQKVVDSNAVSVQKLSDIATLLNNTKFGK